MVERAAEPQAGEHGRQRGRDDHARDLLRQRRAHAARGEQELRVDGADAGGRRQHHREEAVDAGKGDLRLRADAEPGREDRIEDDDRHRIEAGEDRQQQVAQRGEAADQRAGQDAQRRRRSAWRAPPRRASPAALRSRSCRSMQSTVSVFDSDGRNSSGSRPVRGTSSHSDQQERPGSAGGRWRERAGASSLTSPCGSAARCGRAAGRTRRSPSSRRCAAAAA